MGAGHVDGLYLPGSSPVHRLAPQIKLVSAVATVLCVVATPRTEFAAFAAYGCVLLAVTVVARIPLRWLLPRMLIEVPFVALAVLLPFTAGGARVEVAGWPLSVEGLLAASNILTKGTLGVVVSLVLAATTSPSDLLVGMRRLRVPALLTTIAALMLRYVSVIVAEAGRMRVARVARGHDPRMLWQVAATARGVGSLFIRSYERGERVHLAMLSRGWTGSMPQARPSVPPRSAWLAGLLPALSALTVLGVALWTA